MAFKSKLKVEKIIFLSDGKPFKGITSLDKLRESVNKQINERV